MNSFLKLILSLCCTCQNVSITLLLLAMAVCVPRSIKNCATSFPSVTNSVQTIFFIQAEKIASRMIFEDRMQGSIDQVKFSINNAIYAFLSVFEREGNDIR